MGINKVIQYTISCDMGICWRNDQTIVGEDDTWDKASAIKEFRSRGWDIGINCVCPNCSQNLNKENKDGS